LCPHVEWALSQLLECRIDLDWSAQEAERGARRAQLEWRHRAGTAAAITSVLAGWRRLRFEVDEHSVGDDLGQRYSCTPSLGVHRSDLGPDGEMRLDEYSLRRALSRGEQGLVQRLEGLLGSAWDEELEVFRRAGEGTPVRWLHKVG